MRGVAGARGSRRSWSRQSARCGGRLAPNSTGSLLWSVRRDTSSPCRLPTPARPACSQLYRVAPNSTGSLLEREHKP